MLKKTSEMALVLPKDLVKSATWMSFTLMPIIRLLYTTFIKNASIRKLSFSITSNLMHFFSEALFKTLIPNRPSYLEKKQGT
jgi:hypothetical protein